MATRLKGTAEGGKAKASKSGGKAGQRAAKGAPVAEPKRFGVTKTRRFLREVQSEMRKVIWPGRRQVAASTVVVIITVVILGAYTALADTVFSAIVKAIL